MALVTSPWDSVFTFRQPSLGTWLPGRLGLLGGSNANDACRDPQVGASQIVSAGAVLRL